MTASRRGERLAQAREALAAAEQAAAAGAPSKKPDLRLVRDGFTDVDPGPTRPRGSGPDAGADRERAADSRGGLSPSEDGGPDAHEVARQIVLRQLTMGPRTRKQLSDKLRGRNCSDDVAARVLDRLTQVGLIDDGAYARAFVSSRSETKGLAPAALRHELRHRGVSGDLIEEALADIEPEVEKEQARALVAKRLRSLHGLDREVQMRRLAGFLGRKGYGGSLVFEVIREALDTAPEHRRD